MSSSTKSLNKSDECEEQTTKEETTKTEDVSYSSYVEQDSRTVTIKLQCYENLMGIYPISTIKTKLLYLDKHLGETTTIQISGENQLPIEEEFSFSFDMHANKEIDDLLTSPVIFTIVQDVGQIDETLYEELKLYDKKDDRQASLYSAFSLYEAITSTTVEKELKPKKEKKKANVAPISKSSRDSEKISLEKKSDEPPKFESKPIVYGICTLDLLPLILKEESFTESLPIKPTEFFQDDRMISYKLNPRLLVTVTISDVMEFPETPNLLYVTLESIYNLPSLMKKEMDYKACVVLPNGNELLPFVFYNPVYSHDILHKGQKKCWPEMPRVGTEVNLTTYRMNPNTDNIKNTVGIDIAPVFKSDAPKIQFNDVKRNYLLLEGQYLLEYTLSKYRNILVEFYVIPKKGAGTKSQTDEVRDNMSFLSLKRMRKSKFESSGKSPFLHLMAVFDISALLYPGVTSARVAAPLRSYSFKEASELAGQEDSYFRPKPLEETLKPKWTVSDEAVEKEKKKGKGAKKKMDSSVESKKSGATKKKEEGIDLKNLLPDKPKVEPIEEPSMQVYTEDGRVCFAVLEVELSQPIKQKKSTDDIDMTFKELLQVPPDQPKVIMTPLLTKDNYHQTIVDIAHDMHLVYIDFLDKKEGCKCDIQINFINFLRQRGLYQAYLVAITQASLQFISSKFSYNKMHSDKNSVQFQSFIAETYVHLVAEMNRALNTLACTGYQTTIDEPPKPLDALLRYASEAATLGEYDKAERYYVERLSNQDRNPDYWFDYAVFKLSLKRDDDAFVCLRQALQLNDKHENSLLLTGIMLADLDNLDDAENVFLRLLEVNSGWLEGWGVLYLFYEKIGRDEGLEYCLKMCEKYLFENQVKSNQMNDNLEWTASVFPNTVFFRVGTMLLKLRKYNWAESAAAHEIDQHYGLVSYLMAAICYQKHMYNHALEHLQESKRFHGADTAVSSLTGHCHMVLKNFEQAKEEYFYILESYDAPTDIHMVYVNCAEVLCLSGEHQKARKLLIMACKYSPTPYTWFKLGQIFFEEHDYLSAEECLTEANFRDNHCPKIWGYLTMVNQMLDRTNEAQMCYTQAIKNNLKDPKILKDIKAIAKFL